MRATTTNTIRRTPYFAYGANLDPAGMSYRTPGARALGPAQLRGYTLTFREGLANVEPRPGGRVHGALWAVPVGTELRSLDLFEGLYTRELLPVRFAGRTVGAWGYIMEDPLGSEPPSAGYLAAIADGYRFFGLPLAELKAAVKRLG